jgi:ketosteroid isomerase-like protein
MTSLNKQAIETFLSALGEGDAERLADVLTDDAVACAKGTGSFSMERDRATILGAAGMLKAMVPGGIVFTVLSLTEEGERVVAEVEGCSALVDGTPYNNSYAFVARMEGGKIKHLNEYYCTLLVENTLVPMAAAAAGQ